MNPKRTFRLPLRGQQGNGSSTNRTEQERHGLFVLYPSPEIDNGKTLDVDIVAIHGLNGTSTETWTDPQSGAFWLRDFLPDAIPRARIMTFGYDSGLAFSRSKAGIDAFARDLLNRLQLIRTDKRSVRRPLIFVAHSLGGIVVKKAIIRAHEANSQYGSILDSTVGIVFMGTPHRGSDLVPWTIPLSNIINAVTFGRGIRKDLLKLLHLENDMLREISSQFLHRAPAFKIVTFTEQQVEPPLNKLVVPEYSATLGLSNESIYPLNETHRSLCRFPSKNSSYVLVEAVIKNIGTQEDHTEHFENSESSKANHATQAIESRILDDLMSTPNANGKHSAVDINNGRVNVASPSMQAEKQKTSFASDAASVASLPPETIPESRSSLAQIPDLELRSMSSIREQNFVTSLQDSTLPIRVTFTNLRNRLTAENYGQPPFFHSMDIPEDVPIENLGTYLLRSQPGLKYWKTFGYPESSEPIDNTWKDIYTTPILENQPEPDHCVSFFSKAFPHLIEAKLYYPEPAATTGLFSRVSSQHIAISQGGEPDLIISFMRTVRIPEDGKDYPLPPGLGRFPIFNVQPFAKQFPVTMVAQGGLFIPMYQMEAMWIRFKILTRRRFAVRPYVGGINGITGEGTLSNMNSLLRRMNSFAAPQDYVVLPQQRWLDGIASSPGIVKQFIATKFAPPKENRRRPAIANKDGYTVHDDSKQDRGATIEWQITGNDEIGGFQLQFIPEFHLETISATIIPNVSMPSSRYRSKDRDSLKLNVYDPMKTPLEQNLEPGTIIHMKDLANVQPDRPRTAQDLCTESSAALAVREIRLQVLDEGPNKRRWHFNVSKSGVSKNILLSFESDDEFHRILSVVRNAFADHESTLYMSNVIRNRNFTPINSWADLLTICELVLPTRSESYTQLPNGDYECNLILMTGSDTSNTVWTEHVVSEFPPSPTILFIVHKQPTIERGNGKLLAWAMDEHASMDDLTVAIEQTGEFLSSYVILNGNHKKITSNAPDNAATRYTDFEGNQTLYKRFFIAQDRNINIRVTDNNYEVFFEVGTFMPFAKVMTAFCERGGKSLKGCRFIFNHSQIAPAWIIGDYMVDGDVLEVHQEQIGGGYTPNVHVRYDGKTTCVFLSDIDDVGDLKEALVEWSQIPRERQILSCQGIVWDDSKRIDKSSHNLVLNLTAEPERPTALGIGAGGSIKQRIEPDTNDPRIWDTASSKLLNVQILDSSTFRSVTGLDPPPTPMTAETYKATGMPFYEDYTEGPSISGQWSTISGVAETTDANGRAAKRRKQLKYDSLESGLWMERDSDVAFQESGYDFPVVLLNADGTLPEFVGALDDDEAL